LHRLTRCGSQNQRQAGKLVREAGRTAGPRTHTLPADAAPSGVFFGLTMTDRLSLTNALADANIERQKAERIATIIVNAIRRSAGAAPDLQNRQERLARAWMSAGIAEEQARHIAAEIVDLVRERHPSQDSAQDARNYG
jgi:hypothetical protein